MMNEKINSVSRQYTFAVEPVQMFEAQKQAQAQRSSFDFLNQMNFKTSGYNPFHPNVRSETTANKLDILG